MDTISQIHNRYTHTHIYIYFFMHHSHCNCIISLLDFGIGGYTYSSLASTIVRCGLPAVFRLPINGYNLIHNIHFLCTTDVMLKKIYIVYLIVTTYIFLPCLSMLRNHYYIEKALSLVHLLSKLNESMSCHPTPLYYYPPNDT